MCNINGLFKFLLHWAGLCPSHVQLCPPPSTLGSVMTGTKGAENNWEMEDYCRGQSSYVWTSEETLHNIIEKGNVISQGMTKAQELHSNPGILEDSKFPSSKGLSDWQVTVTSVGPIILSDEKLSTLLYFTQWVQKRLNKRKCKRTQLYAALLFKWMIHISESFNYVVKTIYSHILKV